MINSSDCPIKAGFSTDPLDLRDTKQLTALQCMLLQEDLYTAKRLVSSDNHRDRSWTLPTAAIQWFSEEWRSEKWQQQVWRQSPASALKPNHTHTDTHESTGEDRGTVTQTHYHGLWECLGGFPLVADVPPLFGWDLQHLACTSSPSNQQESCLNLCNLLSLASLYCSPQQ